VVLSKEVSMFYLRRALESLRFGVGGPGMLSCFFGIPPQKGDRKSHAVRELGKTGFQVAGVGCECLPCESLGSQFGIRLKESGNSPSQGNEWAGPPPVFHSANARPLQPGLLAGGNA
jgi:hypothetical protein